METLTVFGRAYPVAKRLDRTWYLIAHPNGPALARGDDAPDGPMLASLDHAHESVPEAARDEAIGWLQEKAWLILKGQFFPEGAGL